MTRLLRHQRRLLFAFALLFFCSGLSALIYQVLWLRMFGWVFGVTTHAASAVWATFMAGLAIGSFAAGKTADRVRNPVAWFAAMELLIGLSSLATPRLLDALQQIYVAVHPSLPQSLAGVTAARLAIAFGVLIVPTVLMGATLPFVLKASSFRAGVLDTEVGVLYGSNAAGAIAGTLLSGLYLIPRIGIQRTFLVAAAVNLCSGAGAIALSTIARRHAAAAPPGRAAESQLATMETAPADRQRGLAVVLIVFALSGAVSLALEVVWFRTLVLFLRPTVYSLALMLATVLGGIAIGSYVVAPLLGRKVRWLTTLALLEIAIGIATALSFRPLVYLNAVTEYLLPLGKVMNSYLVYPLTGSLMTIFPVALLMGTAFPIGLRLWASGGLDARHTAERIGLFYSLNVAGAIVGSLAGGFILLPRLGSEMSLIVLATVSLGSGLALLVAADGSRVARGFIAVVAILVFATAVRTSRDPFVEFIAQRYPAMPVVFREEGVEATAVVHALRQGGRQLLMMSINGNHQAGTDYPTTFLHRRIGHLPMIVHPDARTALVIGLGGGATAGAVSIHDGVEVDVVELAGAVVNGARLFDSINYSVLSRPNVNLRVDDGRNHMMLTSKRYDVITADVIQPIFAGAGNVYSVEYFRLMKRVLKPGGVVLQWIRGTEAEYKLIARTFLSVFPYATAWADRSLFIGSLEPLRLSRRQFDARRVLPGCAQALRDAQIETFHALLETFAAGPDEIRAFVGAGPLLTDDRPLAEYFLSLPRDREPDLGSLTGDVSRFVVDH